MQAGTVQTLKLGAFYGFIRSDGQDYFFHSSDLADGLAFDATLESLHVRFDVKESPRGPRAANIRPAAE